MKKVIKYIVQDLIISLLSCFIILHRKRHFKVSSPELIKLHNDSEFNRQYRIGIKSKKPFEIIHEGKHYTISKVNIER